VAGKAKRRRVWILRHGRRGTSEGEGSGRRQLGLVLPRLKQRERGELAIQQVIPGNVDGDLVDLGFWLDVSWGAVCCGGVSGLD